ncbi:type IV secretory pathway protein VirD4 [Streptococcus equi subsp. zooepidemicus SzAM60]|nr:type IV secretory pathway protein VirD4 [Streptococcus equi subsp. zooepidemicus SzAM60]
MKEDELELDTLGDRKTALFVIISDTDDTFNFVVSIMYSQLFNLLCDKADDVYGGRLPIHVRCLLDEFANSVTRSTPKAVGITDKSVA